MSMRVTSGSLYMSLTANLQASLQKVAQTQQQVSTGHRFDVVSDAPFDGVRVLQAQRDLRAVDQYKRNSSDLRTRLDTEQGTLDQVLDIVDTMRSMAIEQGTASSSPETRAASARDVERSIEQLANLGNTRVGDEYLFGGLTSTTAPFSSTSPGVLASTNPTGRRSYEIADQTVVTGPHNGTDLYVNSGVLAAANALRTALDANDLPGIATAADQLQTAFGKVSSLQGEVGALQRSLDNNDNLLGVRENLFQSEQDNAWNVDIAAATTQLAQSQQSLQAAMLAASKTLNISLADYLR